MNTVLSEKAGLLYENYKEPLKAVETGYGYYGTLALSSDRQQVQCHICGDLFKSLGGHLHKSHDISTRDYKQRYEQGATTALIGEGVRQQMQAAAVARHNTPEWAERVKTNVVKAASKSQAVRRAASWKSKSSYPLDRRNKLGICPDQVLEKITDLAKELGRTPRQQDFREKYKGRYIRSIYLLHKSWPNAVRKAGLQAHRSSQSPSDEQLLQELREFHARYDRIPMSSDFRRGLLRNIPIYTRRFGSLNNARIAAGMNAVLPMGFGALIELTPGEYAVYKASHV